MESVESEKKETLKPVIFCNCSRSKCSYQCFVAKVYCVDDCTCNNCHNKQDYKATGRRKSASSSSAKHKVGCQCLKLKCENRTCKCYQDEAGCTKKCRCQDCANSFGMKPEPVLRGAEYWKARSHKLPIMDEVMSDSTEVGTANQLSWTQEKLTDMNNLTVSTHNIGEFQNVSQAESEKGTNLSLKQPCSCNEVLDESLSIINDCEMLGTDLQTYYSVIDDISEMLKDDDMLAIANNFLNGVQPAAATRPCSPTPTTCCNSEDGMNQTEIDNQVDNDNHDK